MQFGIYFATLPAHGKNATPDPTEYSLFFDNDTESGSPAFHEPNDEEYWGSEYEPITYRLVTSEQDIAGAESGPSLASPLPPPLKIIPKRPK